MDYAPWVKVQGLSEKLLQKGQKLMSLLIRFLR